MELVTIAKSDYDDMEKEIESLRQQIREMAMQALTSEGQYMQRIEFMDSMLQEQRRTIEALTMGMEKYGLEGTTPVIRFVANLENDLAEREKELEMANLKIKSLMAVQSSDGT